MSQSAAAAIEPEATTQTTTPEPAKEPVKPEATATPAPEAGKKVSEPGKEPAPVVEYKLNIPDGSLLEKARLEEIVSFAKENKITPEAAQKILDGESQALARHAKAQSDAWEQQAETWVKEVENDKEIGGTDYKKNVELAHRVFKKFGSEKLGQELDRTSLGNHPELLRLAVRIGRAIGEDSFVTPPKGPGRGAERTAAEVLYPSHYKES